MVKRHSLSISPVGTGADSLRRMGNFSAILHGDRLRLLDLFEIAKKDARPSQKTEGKQSGIRATVTDTSFLRAVLGGLVLALAVLVFASGARATEEQWKYFGANQKGERFFYDVKSVMYMPSDRIQVWTRELTSEGPAKKHKEINCAYKIIRDLEVIYEGQQRRQFRSHAPSKWHPIELDPVTMELYKVLCR